MHLARDGKAIQREAKLHPGRRVMLRQTRERLVAIRAHIQPRHAAEKCVTDAAQRIERLKAIHRHAQ